MQIAAKKILITGASRGIGRQLALALGRKGALLALSSREASGLEETCRRLKATGATDPIPITADLSIRHEAQRLAEESTKALGHIDVVINNAALHPTGSQWELSDEDAVRSLWETNYWSPLALAGCLIPAMLERRNGLFVNISSVMQVATWPRVGHYAASKAALSIATETLRMELATSGVRVLHVVPGPIKTKMYDQTSEIPGFRKLTGMSPLGKAEVLAEKVVKAIERDKTRVVYPGITNVPLHFPRSAQRVLARRAKRGAQTAELHFPKVDSKGRSDSSTRRLTNSTH